MTTTEQEPNEQVLHQWDVTRRTAEFFDAQIDRVREIAVTASVAIIGLSLQFDKLPLASTLFPLNVVFYLIDARARRYLLFVTDYAKEIEQGYKFAGGGLTSYIRQQLRTRTRFGHLPKKTGRQSFTRIPIYGIYVLFAAIGIVTILANAGNWATYIIHSLQDARIIKR